METLVAEIQTLQNTIAHLEARTNDTSRVVQRLTNADETQAGQAAQQRRPPKVTAAKVQYFSNREVQNSVRRRKPESFEKALEIANEET